MVTTTYRWDALSDNVICEDDGTTQTIYTNEPGQYGDLISQNDGTSSEYYHFDGRGDTREITDGSQNVSDTRTYSAWGDLLASTGSTDTPYQFVGKHGYAFDATLDQYYVRARWYEAHTARWSSVDPLGYVDDVNLFRYVRNSAISYVDPSGHEWVREGHSRTIYKATSFEDSLYSLASQITGQSSDWVCIWPIPDGALWASYPLAQPCAKANVSNLLSRGGRFTQIALKRGDDDGYLRALRHLMPSANAWRSGRGAAEDFKRASHQGRTPIGRMHVIGHNFGVREMCAQGGVNACYTSQDVFDVATEKNNLLNTYASAIKKIGPPKCWLARNATVWGVGCNSAQAWAPDWAARIARVPSTVKGAPSVIEGVYQTRNGRTQAGVKFLTDPPGPLHLTWNSFMQSPRWVNFPGTQ